MVLALLAPMLELLMLELPMLALPIVVELVFVVDIGVDVAIGVAMVFMFVFMFVAGLFAFVFALLAAGSQAIPKAPTAKTAERAITFFIFSKSPVFFLRLIILFAAMPRHSRVPNKFLLEHWTI